MVERFHDDVAAHLAAAEALARSAGLDLIGVGHVVAAMLGGSSWLRGELGGDADALRGAVLDRLGRGSGEASPTWSPRLREVLDRVGGDGGVDERALIAAIAVNAEGVVAEVIARLQRGP